MTDYGNLIQRANENGAGVLVIRVLAAGALTGVRERHPVAVPTVAPIGSGRDYDQDFDRAGKFAYLVHEGHVQDLAEASIRFALSNQGVSSVLVGYSSIDHLEASVAFADKGSLPDDALAKLPEIWSRFKA